MLLATILLLLAIRKHIVLRWKNKGKAAPVPVIVPAGIIARLRLLAGRPLGFITGQF